MNRTLIAIMDICEIEQWADSRETSIEIAEVILEFSQTEEEAQRIWEEPSYFEAAVMPRLAFDKTDDNELFWGVRKINR